MNNLKIELKAVKFMESLSEETACFSANIYINGKRAGRCENRGHGGSTSYHIEDKEIAETFEHYASGLPDLELKGFSGKQLTIAMNGEHLIDALFNDWLKAREEKKFAKLDKKYKAQYEAKGWIAIRVTLDDSMLWIAARSEADAPRQIEIFEKKEKETVKSWEIL